LKIEQRRENMGFEKTKEFMECKERFLDSLFLRE